MEKRWSKEFSVIREAVWVADPLAVADSREYAPDEYDDIAWRILRAQRGSDPDADIEKLWQQQIEELGVGIEGKEYPPFATFLSEAHRRFPLLNDK